VQQVVSDLMSDGEPLANARMRRIVTNHPCFSIDDQDTRHLVAKLHALYQET